MRALIAIAAALLAMLMLHSCAAERPSSAALAASPESLAADSLGNAALDALFTRKYGAVAAALAARESAEEPDADALEARSLVAAAEEMYLYGKTLVAIRLLDEASTLLRRNR